MSYKIEDLQAIAVDLAKKAGNIIKQDFQQHIDKQWKADTSPFTKTDLSVNNLVLETLTAKTPDLNILSEEESRIINENDSFWVCDPLDGTLAFAHGIPTCAFSLAYVEQGVPKLGVIYDPFLDRMIVGVKDQGTTMNGKPMHVTETTDFNKMVIGVSFWKGEQFDSQDILKRLTKKGAFIVNFYSIAYKGLLVGNGRMCGGVYIDNKAHDVAALKVIIEEAGGKVTDLDGNDQRYDQDVHGCVFSNGLIHDELLAITKNTIKA